MIRRWVWFLPFCLWLCVVFIFSSQSYSQQSIRPFLKEHVSETKLKQVVPDVSFRYHKSRIDSRTNPYGFVEFFFRKGAHLFVYAVLAATASLALYKMGFRSWGWIGMTLLLVAFAAAADEWNQASHLGRTGLAADVGIDLVGGVIGMGAAFICSRRF